MGISYSSHVDENKNNDIETLEKTIMEKNMLIKLLEIQNDNLKLKKDIDSDIFEQIRQTRDNREYHYLVLSGGGIKGITHCGALLELHNLNILYNEQDQLKLKGIAGVSAGSIIAGLLAVGYTPKELLEIVKTLDIKRIFTDNHGYMKDSKNLIEHYGTCSGNYLLELLGDLIEKKTGNKDYTLEQLLDNKNIKLIIVSTNLNYSMSIYFYAGHKIKEYSNIPIRFAIRMSMGIPFIFEPFSYNNCLFADGGILDNCPIHVFDGEYPGDPKARLNLCKPNPHVLGLNIMTSNENMNYELTNKSDCNSISNYIFSYINLFLSENERRMLTPYFWIRAIIIVTPNYPVSKYEINDDQKQILIDLGKQYVKSFFNNKTI